MKNFLKDVTSFLISFITNIGFFLTGIGKIVTHPQAVFIIIGIWVIAVIIYIISKYGTKKQAEACKML